MSFTEKFDTATVEQKNVMTAEERQKRIQENIDYYTPVPVAVPVMGKLSTNPVDYKLGWAVGVPGRHEDHTGKPARAALTLGFPDEETAEDFCFMMNEARKERNELAERAEVEV